MCRSPTGSRDGDELVAELDRLYVPRNDARRLRQRTDRRRQRRHPRAGAGGATVRGRLRSDPQRDGQMGSRAHRGSQRDSGPRQRPSRRARPRGSQPGRRAGRRRRDRSGLSPRVGRDSHARTLALAACRAIERIVLDVAVASVRLEPVDVSALVRDAVAAHRVRGADIAVVVDEGLGVDGDPYVCVRSSTISSRTRSSTRLVRGDGSRSATRRRRPRRGPTPARGSRPTSSTASSTLACAWRDTPGSGLGLASPARSHKHTVARSRPSRRPGKARRSPRPARGSRSARHSGLQLVVAKPSPVRSVLADRERRPRRGDVDVFACDAHRHAAHDRIDLVVAAMRDDDVCRVATRLDPRECERLAVLVTADEVQPRIAQPSCSSLPRRRTGPTVVEPLPARSQAAARRLTEIVTGNPCTSVRSTTNPSSGRPRPCALPASTASSVARTRVAAVGPATVSATRGGRTGCRWHQAWAAEADCRADSPLPGTRARAQPGYGRSASRASSRCRTPL